MTTEQNKEDNKGPDWRALEASRDKALNQANAWKDLAVKSMIQGAGFKVDDPVVGLLIKEFNTDDLDPTSLNPTSFVEFAKGYNVQPQTQEQAQTQEQNPDLQQQITAMQQGQPVPGTPGTPVPPNTLPPAQQYAAMQVPADQLAAAAQQAPPAPTDINGQIAQAEAQGNWGAAYQAKMALLGRQAMAAGVGQHGSGAHTPGQ